MNQKPSAYELMPGLKVLLRPWTSFVLAKIILFQAQRSAQEGIPSEKRKGIPTFLVLTVEAQQSPPS